MIVFLQGDFMKYLAPLLMTAYPLFGVDLSVNINCNGQSVRQLQIAVFDSTGVQVPNLNETDPNGAFVIVNSEHYLAPFSMFFTLRNGSQCGSYPITQSSATEGAVYLNYYPTELPCSCSKLVQ